jgi:hypothetical protein
VKYTKIEIETEIIYRQLVHITLNVILKINITDSKLQILYIIKKIHFVCTNERRLQVQVALLGCDFGKNST